MFTTYRKNIYKLVKVAVYQKNKYKSVKVANYQKKQTNVNFKIVSANKSVVKKP